MTIKPEGAAIKRRTLFYGFPYTEFCTAHIIVEKGSLHPIPPPHPSLTYYHPWLPIPQSNWVGRGEGESSGGFMKGVPFIQEYL